jgi:hypothetical protein
MDEFELFQNYSCFEDESQYGLYGDLDFAFNFSSFSFPDDYLNALEPGFSIPELENDNNTDQISFMDGFNAVNVDEDSSFPSSLSSSATLSTDTSSKSTSAHTIMQFFPSRSQELSSTQYSNEHIQCPTAAKRKWQDQINVFSVEEGRKVGPRRRKGFSHSKKQMVALNRLIGACIPCKLRKGEVRCAIKHFRVTPLIAY